jgi:hypothetical protein
MSKKDYELIARTFAGINPDHYTSTVEVRAALLHQLALNLKGDNDSFNIVKFVRACSPTNRRKGNT